MNNNKQNNNNHQSNLQGNHQNKPLSLADWEAKTNTKWEDSQLTQGMRHAIIDIGEGINLSVEVGGNPNNPPLLLVLGLGSQMVFWPNDFIKRLINAGFFVIRFDNRDVGLSTKVKAPELPKPNRLKLMLKMQAGISNHNIPIAYNLVDMAEDTKRLIDRLNLTDINLMGASMGGIISQILTAKYPQYIRRLMVLFSTTNRKFLQIPKTRQLMTFFRRPASFSEKDFIRHSVWFMNTVGSPGHVNIKQVREIAKLRYDRCFYPRGSVQHIQAILATGSISKYSKQINVPTLVMHGSEDGLVPASHGRNIAKTIPNAKFHLIEGMGHDIPSYFQPHIVDLMVKHCLQQP